MSVAALSALRSVRDVSPTQKLVLYALADMADDGGRCWPSMATITARTQLSERAAQGAIRALETSGLIVTSRPHGRTTTYRLVLSTPAADAPPQEMHPAADAPTPASNAPPPPQQVRPTPAADAPRSVNEASREASRKPKERAALSLALEMTLPPWLPQAEWERFVANRKALKKPMTTGAVTVMLGKLADMHSRGINIAKALDESTANGWQGVFEPRGAVRVAPRESDLGNLLSHIASDPDIHGEAA